jgi:two-component system chemotaxis sensor kinase CheA
MSAAMDFTQMAEFSHLVEDVFNKIKSSEIKLSTADYDKFYGWLDKLKEMIDSIAKNGVEKKQELKELLEIKNYLGGKKSTEKKEENSATENLNIQFNDSEIKTFHKTLDQGTEIFKYTISISKKAPMPSVRIFQIIQKLNELGTILKTIPSADKLEEAENIYTFAIYYTPNEEAREIYRIISAIREVDNVTMLPISKNDIINKKTLPKEEVSQKKKVIKSSIVEPTIKVKISHLDALVNLIGELMINTIRLNDISKEFNIKQLKDEIINFQRVTSDLQDRILLARMVPVGQIFSKYPRIIRDLTKKFNKEVDFSISGNEIELDRIILDEIDEPLIHLLRNAVDHGIETPAERLKKGKNRIAKIELNARREKNRVIIEVKDDGNGLDIKKIRNKALHMGIVTKEKLPTMSRSDIYMLVCKPGFSTASKVTDMSGRGVGMDVVKNKIDSLNGVLRIESSIGKGTTFTIILPMTLAIIQTLIASIRGIKFLIPIANIQETMELKKNDIKIVKGKEVIFLRDEEIVPLIRMDELLGFERIEEPSFPVILVELGEKKAGLVFDELHSKQQTVIKSLDSVMKKSKRYSGKGLLSSGEPALILDIAAILE